MSDEISHCITNDVNCFYGRSSLTPLRCATNAVIFFYGRSSLTPLRCATNAVIFFMVEVPSLRYAALPMP